MARPKIRNELKALNIKIDAKIYAKLDKESLKTGIPKTVLTEKALEQYLKQKKTTQN